MTGETTETLQDPFEKWTQVYKKIIKSGDALAWPSETLIRLFKGPYLPDLQHQHITNKKVLDVGCGAGNNLIFLDSLGLELYATEVTEQLCSIVKQKLNNININIDVRCGTNITLPFPDNYFDFLVSWNVIHYQDNANDMDKAIQEYQRVLKPNGRFFISTTGPDHKIKKNGRSVGKNLYKIGREDDHRAGQTFYYFDTEEEVKIAFTPYFANLQIGRTHDRFFSETLDWFIVTGQKPIDS